MAFNPTFKMSIQDESGGYYTATQNTDATWTVTTVAGVSYIKTLPDGWNETAIVWERDKSYLGIFRSKADTGYHFSKDAKAIIEYIRSNEGIQGYGLLTIYIANGFLYDTFYVSELDFKTYKNNHQTRLLEIETLDSGLYRDLHAYGNSKFNLPIWENTAAPGDPAVWVTDANWVLHDGIKLLYNATFTSSATDTNNLTYLTANGNPIIGYNRGQFGSFPHSGAHTIPFLATLNITQNNGTTTFIGNDILQPFLLQGNQAIGANAPYGANENVFWGTNNSQPYTRNNFSLKDNLKSAASFDMYVNVSAVIESTIDQFASPSSNPFLGFVMWEINQDVADVPPGYEQYHLDMPPIISLGGGDSGMDYIPIYKYPLDAGGLPTPGGTVNVTVPVTIRYDKCYVFGLIFDCDGGFDTSNLIDQLIFSKLQFSILSKYDSGTSGTPVPAPYFPPSVTAAFTLSQLLAKIAPALATTQTDGYGFPVPVTTDYEGVSDFLSDSTVLVKDVCPNQIMITSAYCLHNLAGQSYITMSINELFDFCKKSLGCGMAIEGSTLRIEDLSYFFDATTEILDLGFNVAEFEEMQLVEGLGASLKLGYIKADTNSDFGVDPFNTELFFNTPCSNIPNTIDLQENSILTEMYAIEKYRAQRTSQPIGTVIDPANPSGNNQSMALYCLPYYTQSLPNTAYPIQPYNPDSIAYPTDVFQLTQRNGINLPAAQSTDDTAAVAPYIQGLYYPDTAFNVELSPCRALGRDIGAYLHSVLDSMESEYLIFRNTVVMQYNNTTLGLSSIESNLEIGSGAGNVTTEFKDVAISSLPDQLFKPVIYKVKSKYPINMYTILNNNPNGYIKFSWRKEGFGYTEYKMFLSKATYMGGTEAATEFIGWAHPEMVL